MRIGVLGPAGGDMGELGRAARYLVDEARADKIIYMADDGALDHVVFQWARSLVSDNPEDDALFVRAAARCARAMPAEIAAFIDRERMRQRLRVFSNLVDRTTRSIELLGGRVVLFALDNTALDEDDIATSPIIVLGRSASPLIRKAGTRLFVAPGTVAVATGGCMLLDDGGGGVRIVISDSRGAMIASEQVGSSVVGKVRIRGGA